VQQTVSNEQVELSGDIERDANWLRVRYTLINRCADDLFLTVRTKIEGERPNRPYSFFRPADSVMTLSFTMCPPPPDIEIYAPIMPLSVKVKANESYQNFAEAEVPIQEMHPYSEPAYPRDLLPVEVSQLVFANEYVVAPDAKFVRDVKNHSGFYRVGGSPKRRLELQFNIHPPVTVLKRAGAFYRCS
jgi:hypothetical protein